MKITITMKDPDAAYEAARDAAIAQIAKIGGLNARERDELINKRAEDITQQLHKWMKYGEYLTVEFDLEAGSATVSQNN